MDVFLVVFEVVFVVVFMVILVVIYVVDSDVVVIVVIIIIIIINRKELSIYQCSKSRRWQSKNPVPPKQLNTKNALWCNFRSMVFDQKVKRPLE